MLRGVEIFTGRVFPLTLSLENRKKIKIFSNFVLKWLIFFDAILKKILGIFQSSSKQVKEWQKRPKLNIQ